MPLTSRHLIAISALGIVLVTGIALLARPARLSTQVGDVNVACGPSQRALVRHLADGATPRVEVTCADDLELVQSGYSPSGRLMPAALKIERPLVAPAAPAVRTVRAASPTRPVSPASERDARPSWQKRALIIGGSAGAGAGIGALAGGKKGALIGAAIGGGGALVVDQIKNK